MFFATLGVIASSIERLAIEIRHLQRTEVLEAEEYFSEGQKGSSAMPHKRNPVLTENLTGLARLVRGMVTAGDGECRALARARHLAFLGRADDRARRDDHARLRAGAADRRDRQAARLSRATCRKISIALGGLIHSQRVLLALTQKGVSREDAYALVQRNAMPVWRGEGDFLTLLKKDKDVKKVLSDAELEDLFDLGYHLKHVDFIFTRVFGERDDRQKR